MPSGIKSFFAFLYCWYFRFQSLESEKLAKIAEKFNKIEEAARKRLEEENNFKNSTMEALKQKMEVNIGNKEKIVADLKTKLSTHVMND